MNSGEVRPLRWWTTAQLEALREVLENPWTRWLGDWYGEPSAGLTCTLAHEASGGAVVWHLWGTDGTASVWSDLPSQPEGAVRTALFGAETTVAADSLAGRMEAASRKALLSGLAAALGVHESWQPSSPRPSDRLVWSGGVIASMTAGSVMLRLFLNGPCVEKALNLSDAMPADRSAPVEEGVSLVRTRASVELSGCEITLGELRTVAVGDILRLPHRLGAPLQVKVGGGQVCAAHLGRRADFRAIELLQPPTS